MGEEFFLKDASEEKLKRIAHLKKLAESGVNLAEYLEEEKRKASLSQGKPEITDKKNRSFEDSELVKEARNSGRPVEEYIEIINRYDTLILRIYNTAKELEKAFWDNRNKLRKTKDERTWNLGMRVQIQKRGDLASPAVTLSWACFEKTGKKPRLQRISKTAGSNANNKRTIFKKTTANQWEKMLYENYNPLTQEIIEELSNLQAARANAVRVFKSFLSSRIPLR